MFALEIEFLTGRYVATAFDDRKGSEWPPHPARVFSALVATYGEAEAQDPMELEALRWLEGQPPPEIAATDATAREVVTVFVPVNDTTVAKSVGDLGDELDQAEADHAAAQAALAVVGADAARRRAATREVEQTGMRCDGLRSRLVRAMAPDEKVSAEGLRAAWQLLPEGRVRQPRTFPSVTPERSIVHLTWPAAEPSPAHRGALQQLAERVVRIGHSSSLVRCSVAHQPHPTTWVSDQAGDEVLRVTAEGQFDRLEEDFRADPPRTTGARPCAYARYRRVDESRSAPEAPAGAFDASWVVLRRVAGPRLPSTRSVELATAVRGALLTHAEQPLREVLSGHANEGGRAETDHLAIVPLSFVGSRHADGRIQGIALVLPRTAGGEDRRHVYRALGNWERTRRLDDERAPTLQLWIPGLSQPVEVERVLEDGASQANLRPETWCRPSRRWVSVTPVALDRNPGKLRSRDPDLERRARTEARAASEACATIAQACLRIGLPEPASVVVLPSVSLAGTEKALRFPPYPPDSGRTRRVKVHAELIFSTPVAGPILLGAGRYQGLGLFRPVREDDDEAHR